MALSAIEVLQEVNAAMPKSQWMNLEELKAEYRLASDGGDPWGSCMSALFPVATELDLRAADIPPAWGYRAGACGPFHEEGDYWAEIAPQATTEALLAFGNMLHRLSGILTVRGLSY